MVATAAATAAGVTTAPAAIATDASAGATAATMTSQSLTIAPNEGDTDDREKNRDAEQQSTIHPKVPPTNRYRT
ncbi:MAG TPA: hypothetical protein VFI31_19555 [Pirellulales bacterium]|nr:hypothetical protein [Pirellulales bacterium]